MFDTPEEILNDRVADADHNPLFCPDCNEKLTSDSMVAKPEQRIIQCALCSAVICIIDEDGSIFIREA